MEKRNIQIVKFEVEHIEHWVVKLKAENSKHLHANTRVNKKTLLTAIKKYDACWVEVWVDGLMEDKASLRIA